MLSTDERVENTETSNTLLQVTDLIEHSNAVSKEMTESSGRNSHIAPSNASENVMDVTVMKIGHEIASTVVNKIGQNEFSEQVYAEKILNSIRDGNVLDWSAFGKRIIHIVKMPRFSQTMYGAFDIQSDPVMKEKKERVVRRKAVVAEMKRPEKVQNLQKEEKGVQIVALVKECIQKEHERRNHVPIPYYELIFDPDDFMHTIDNAFQVAFLVRDGAIGVTVGENKDPQVYVPSKEEQNLKKLEKKTTQTLIGLNYGKYLELKKRFSHMKEPILKLNRDHEKIPPSQNLTQRMEH